VTESIYIILITVYKAYVCNCAIVQLCNCYILVCFTSWCEALWWRRKCCRNIYGRCETAFVCI